MQVNIIESSDIINQDVITKNEKIEEESFEPDQSKSTLRNSSNPKSPAIDLGIDWGSDEVWERGFIHYVMDDKKQRQQQLQLIEQGRHELGVERQQIAQERQSLDQRENNLKTREAEIADVEPLARRFQSMRVSGTSFILWSEVVQNYSITHNTDLATAESDVAKMLEAFKDLQLIRNVINDAEEDV